MLMLLIFSEWDLTIAERTSLLCVAYQNSNCECREQLISPDGTHCKSQGRPPDFLVLSPRRVAWSPCNMILARVQGCPSPGIGRGCSRSLGCVAGVHSGLSPEIIQEFTGRLKDVVWGSPHFKSPAFDISDVSNLNIIKHPSSSDSAVEGILDAVNLDIRGVRTGHYPTGGFHKWGYPVS